MIYDTAIVGVGVAGYTAALTAKSLKLRYLWFADDGFGEKTKKAEYVRNFPAFTGGGKEFCAALEMQREKEGVERVQKRVDGVYKTGENFMLTVASEAFEARTVILATGVQTRSVAGEGAYLGKGVSYCAVCDGALYRGKKVAVALFSPRFCEEAEYLASFAAEVRCFCSFGCSFRSPNITVCKERVLRVEGENRVERVITDKGAYPADGVFFLTESVPPSALCGGLECEGERVITRRDGSTNLKGLFAAGDVAGRPYQYVKAAGEGCVAAYSVASYLRAEARA